MYRSWAFLGFWFVFVGSKFYAFDLFGFGFVYRVHRIYI